MEEPRFDPFDYVSAFRRRKWWFIVPMGVAVVTGLLLVWLLPRTYLSAAVVGVSSPRLQPGLVEGATVNDSDRIRAISQQLLSRPVLERTAQLEEMDKTESLDAAINRLRANASVTFASATIKGNLTPEQRNQLDSYEVTLAADSADAAQRLLNRLVSVFVEENSKSREVRAQDTSEFIAAQLRASEEKLIALEAKLREAKEAHMGRLPEQINSNLAMVATLQRQVDANATTLRGEQDRLSMIEQQIGSMEQGTDVGPVTRGAPAGNVQARVVQLRNELAEALLTLTERHPEVMRLREELEATQQAAAAERQRPISDRVSILRANPEYRRLTNDRDAARLRIQELQRQQQRASAQIRSYQARVEEAPRVEQELVSLTRAYQLEREAYNELTERHQAALLNEELQRKQGGEQFAVLAPASYPSEPFQPKPLRVLLMAIAAGLVIGAGGVMGREYLDRSVHDARGLRDEFELPVLAEIPRIEPVIS